MNKSLFFIILLLDITIQVDYKLETQNLCQNIDLTLLTTDGDIRQKEREKYSTPLALEYADIVQFRKNNSVSTLLKGSFIVLLVICIILLLLAIAAFIIFLLNLCLCKKVQSTPQKFKTYMILNLVFFVLFAIFVILTLIFALKTISNTKEIRCLSAKFPNDIINGINQPDYKFIGFTPLLEMFTAFSNELEGLKSLNTNFQNIVNQNLPSLCEAGKTASNDFENKFKNLTIEAGNGSQKIPNSGGTNLTKAMDIVRAEFQVYNDIGKAIHDASIEGQKLSNDSDYNTILKSINDVKAAIQQTLTGFTSFADNLFDIFGKMDSGTKGSNIGIIIATIALLVIFLIILLFLYLQWKQKKFMGLNCCFKILIIIISFVFIIIALVLIAVLIISYIQGSACNIFKTILTASDISTLFTDINVTVDEKVKDMLNNCVVAGKSGNLQSLIKEVDFSRLQNLLDGITSFKNFKTDFEARGQDSKAIIPLSAEYVKVKEGKTPNTTEIGINLNELNQGISCNSQKIVLHNDDCGGVTNCQILANTSSFTQPACSTALNLNTLFANAKNYSNTNIQLMDQVITDLGGNAANTQKTKFVAMRTGFGVVFGEFVNIENKLSQTIKFLTSFTVSFVSATNCTIVRKELLQIEASFCFALKQNLFYFFIFFLIASFFVLFLEFSFCCTMRHQNQEQEPNKQTDLPPEKYENTIQGQNTENEYINVNNL